MNDHQCLSESRIAAAVRSGAWTPELLRHVAECEHCAGVAAVTAVLCASAAEPVEVPAPGLVWWKAQIRRRLEARERMSRPLQFFDRITGAAGIAAAIWGLLWVNTESTTLVALAAGGFLVLGAAAGSLYWFANRR